MLNFISFYITEKQVQTHDLFWRKLLLTWEKFQLENITLFPVGRLRVDLLFPVGRLRVDLAVIESATGRRLKLARAKIAYLAKYSNWHLPRRIKVL